MTDSPFWEILFWLSLGGLTYIYIGYPMVMRWLARRFPRQHRKAPVDQSVSIVVVAYDEAENLDRKIRSLLESTHAPKICEILVASDGSTDHTPAVVESCNDPRVRLIQFEERRGKPAVLNEVIPQCLGDIVVLTDARQVLTTESLAELTANLADETVGAVSGELVFRSSEDTTTASNGVGVYWRYEKSIRKCESRFRSVPGATGALYAIRKSLFRPIPTQTILDDVVIPMQIVERGYRCVFEPNGVAYDNPSKCTQQEAIRKRRTIAGSVQLVVNQPRWLLPWKNPIWFEFVSHKISRLFSPFLLLTVAIANCLLAGHPVYLVLLAVHVDFYLAALTGWTYQNLGRRSVCFGMPLMFLMMNGATLLALWDALRSKYHVAWRRAVPLR